MNAEKQFFICLQNEAENVSCNPTEKGVIIDQIEVIENETAEAIQFLKNKRADLNDTKNELEQIETKLQGLSKKITKITGKNRQNLDNKADQTISSSTALFPQTTKSIDNLQTNESNYNCQAILGIPKQNTVAETYDSEDFAVNNNNTENITIVFTIGQKATKKASRVATDTLREIEVDCCINGKEVLGVVHILRHKMWGVAIFFHTPLRLSTGILSYLALPPSPLLTVINKNIIIGKYVLFCFWY